MAERVDPFTLVFGVLAYAKYHGVGKITCALSAPRAAACPAIVMAAITPLMAG